MKQIEVVAGAVIGAGRLFATQRGYGPWAGWWEFPGGKVEPGEGLEDALRRELREELRLEVNIIGLIDTIDYDYPDFHLHMHLFHCTPLGDPMLTEHSAARWLDAAAMDSVKWLPADLQILPRVASLL